MNLYEGVLQMSSVSNTRLNSSFCVVVMCESSHTFIVTCPLFQSQSAKNNKYGILCLLMPIGLNLFC